MEITNPENLRRIFLNDNDLEGGNEEKVDRNTSAPGHVLVCVNVLQSSTAGSI